MLKLGVFMSQGGNAVYSGIAGENKVNSIICESFKIKPDKIGRLKYQACWYNKQLNQNDFLFTINGLKVGGEVKNQNGGGSKDICVISENSNAFKRVIKSKKFPNNHCDKYFIVLTGNHWKTKRGQNIIKTVKEDIKIFSMYYGTSQDICEVVLVDDFANRLSLLRR